MKILLLFFIVFLPLSVSGQSGNIPSRRLEIEKCMAGVYSIQEFHWVADSIQMTTPELSDYPVICPIRKPEGISSGFGMRFHPVYKKRLFHTGIDIAADKCISVHASGNGVVIQKGYDSGYGNFVEIKHAGGFRSFYAHLSKTIVNVGDTVSIAEQIAFTGNTGSSTGCHLHYEIRKGKRYLNPIGWCNCLFKAKIQREEQQSN